MSSNVSPPLSFVDSAKRYQPKTGFYDEAIAGEAVRPHWRGVTDSLNTIGHADLSRRWQEARRFIRDNGITYNVYSDPQATERPWPLDPVPLILGAAEWKTIEAAIIQRATLLNALLADFYGSQKLLREGHLPPELVFDNPAFLRPCANIHAPGGAHLHLYSADIARSPDGRWWVIADRTQAPSGAGYALENRLVTNRVLPDVIGGAQVRRLAAFFQSYRETLINLVPRQRENPRIVLLTPGPYNETYFEHAFLARYLGYTLVEGGDLTVRDNHVFLKTLGGLLPVDVILRRQDDSFCDPLELRGDSILGVAGLVEAVRSGNVAIANTLGSGAIESPAHSAFLPSLCKDVLDEDLKMPSVATWWCGQEKPMRYVSENLANLVVKPAYPAYGKQPIFGARLTKEQAQTFLARVKANPGHYVAQEHVALSTVPVWDEGATYARHLVLRVFAVATGGSYTVMPGGLTRVSSSQDSFVVSMQRGGGSKDTWILADHPSVHTSLLRPPANSLEISRATFDLPSRVADNLFWLGRYAERVEFAVRVIRAALPRLGGEASLGNSAGLQACLRVLTALGYLPTELATDAPNLEKEILSLVYDSGPKGSLGWNIHEIRSLARMLRDRISIDAWRILNSLDERFSAPRDGPLRIGGAFDRLNHVVASMSAFTGLVLDGMTRGYGWRFLEIGRRLEHALQLTEVLLHGMRNPDPAALEGILEVADSTITYRSRYLTSLLPELVLDLLLIDEANPRAVAFKLARLCEHIDELPESRSLIRRPAEARMALSLLTSVQLADARELVHPEAQETFLIRLASDLKLLSEKLTLGYFNHAVASRQMLAL